MGRSLTQTSFLNIKSKIPPRRAVIAFIWLHRLSGKFEIVNLSNKFRGAWGTSQINYGRLFYVFEEYLSRRIAHKTLE